jgi:hypothetical protein
MEEIVKTPAQIAAEIQRQMQPEEPQEEQQVQEQVQEEPEEQSVPQHAANENFRTLREKAYRAEWERDQALKRTYELEARLQKPQDDEPEVPVSPNDLAEVGYIDKRLRKIERDNQQNLRRMAEQALVDKYPDFKAVFNDANIAQLEQMHPGLTVNTQDFYSSASSVYKLIKNLGIYKDQTMKNKETIQKNLAKPRSLNSVSPTRGDSPLSRVNEFATGAGEFTAQEKARIWKEMQDVINSR